MLPVPFLAMDPADDLGWLAVADWLEEHDDPRRAELVRLTHTRGDGDRLVELLAAGVEPCVATVTNSIGMEFAYIPAGTFLMGSLVDEGEGYRSGNEGPVHEVEITKGFYLGMYAVTQGEYEGVMGSNPSRFWARGDGKAQVNGMKTSRFPVEQVGNKDARKFCKKLSGTQEEKEKKRLYRLPTEAEWEYACRGGAGMKQTPFHFGKTLSSNQANFNGNFPYGGGAKGPYLERTCEVGSFEPNGFGLYDMHGNVNEWCWDYAQIDYDDSPLKDPVGPFRGTTRIHRGGDWQDNGRDCRSARRTEWPGWGSGFRVVLVPSR